MKAKTQNLKRQQQRQTAGTKQWLFAVIVAAVLVIGAGSAYAWHRHQDHRKAAQAAAAAAKTAIRGENSIDYSPPSPTDNQGSESRKSSNPDSSSSTSGSASGGTGSSSSGSSSTASFTVTVTGAHTSGTNVIVGTLVSGTTSGTCTVTFTQSGQANVTATNSVALEGNNYACPNFAVPFSDFPAGGQWNVSVSVSNNGQTASGQWAGNPITINK